MSAPASPPGASGSPAPSSDPIPPGTPAANTYNWVYRQLVTDPNDAVGAFAYILYKQEKIAFIEAIKQSQGREPTLEELRTSIHRPARSRESIPTSRVPNSWPRISLTPA
jgi:hypothetical protein